MKVIVHGVIDARDAAEFLSGAVFCVVDSRRRRQLESHAPSPFLRVLRHIKGVHRLQAGWMSFVVLLLYRFDEVLLFLA